MATIIECGPDNPDMDAFDLIFKESFYTPYLNLRTPVFNIHILHFAAASISLSCLKHAAAKVPLNKEGYTSLCHTLLHIVTLPLDESQINFHSTAILRSMHDVHTLYVTWKPELTAISFPSSGFDDITEVDILRDESKLSRPQNTDFFVKQLNVARYLLEKCVCREYDVYLHKPGIYRNTPLHYVVSYRTVNIDLLGLLIDNPGGQETWMEVGNQSGFTPHELFERGLKAIESVS